MRIGIDFDNTLVRYDALFHRVALEEGLIPAVLPVNKNAVRDHLRAQGIEARWTEMQGTVYGGRMAEAEAFPGVREALQRLHAAGAVCIIVSHKTRYPFLGAQHDLHAAARGWLAASGLLDAAAGLAPERVFFELTKEAKLERIAQCGCTHFIDDLPEILDHPLFPQGVKRYLFDPAGTLPAAPSRTSVSGWPALAGLLAP